METQDKVVIVTGASMGIGEATARLLAQRGARVALVARSAERLAELGRALPGSFICTTDVRDPDAIQAMVAAVQAHYGRIDALVNNAGRGMHGTPVEKTGIEQFRELFELNIIGPLVAMQAVIPIMRQQGGGVIVNISSKLSRLHIPGVGAYAATKYMLNGLTLTARQELAPDNIRVVLVLPGRTATHFQLNSMERHPDPVRAQPSGDPVELVAQRIVEAIETEPEELVVNS